MTIPLIQSAAALVLCFALPSAFYDMAMNGIARGWAPCGLGISAVMAVIIQTLG